MSSKNNNANKLIENFIESFLWNTRLIILLAVFFSLLGSLILFLVGSLEIIHTIQIAFPHQEGMKNINEILIGIIGAIDLFLIGIVLMIFSFGVYELFISKIDIARLHEDITILDIKSLDELKNKILKVIVMVLIVTFFKSTLVIHFNTPLEMLYLALSIISIASGVYLLKKNEGDH